MKKQVIISLVLLALFGLMSAPFVAAEGPCFNGLDYLDNPQAFRDAVTISSGFTEPEWYYTWTRTSVEITNIQLDVTERLSYIEFLEPDGNSYRQHMITISNEDRFFFWRTNLPSGGIVDLSMDFCENYQS